MVGGLTNGSKLSDRMFILSIANIGEETIKLVSAELQWKKQKLFFIQDQLQGDKNFPFDLLPKENAIFWVLTEVVTKTISRKGASGKEDLRVCFNQQLGKNMLVRNLRYYLND